MQIKLKSLHLTDFKGVRDETYTFGDITKIMVANGGGKSTIATGWFWLFVDRDYALHSNPNVVPLGVEECLPRVEAVLDIDGVEVTVVKQQKITTGKPDARGISKTTTSNTYEINSVPKTERDFKADLEEKGFDFELFLPLSHPNVFTSQKAADMRKVLFKMVTDKTDFDVALETDGAADVAALLKMYKFDEIDKMNKALQLKMAANKSKTEAMEELAALPEQADISDNQEYEALQLKLSNMEKLQKPGCIFITVLNSISVGGCLSLIATVTLLVKVRVAIRLILLVIEVCRTAASFSNGRITCRKSQR